MKIGFIGIGNMGGPIATNLIEAGYSLIVYSRKQESAKFLTDKGALWVKTPRAVAEASNVIFTALPGPKEVETVALGSEGLIIGIQPGCTYIDLSTISPALIRQIYSKFKEKGAAVMDSPVSGGPEGARSRKLSMMVGGDKETFQQIKPILETMGDKITYTGSIGSGLICKIVHQSISYALLSAIAEGLTLAVKSGVDAQTVFQAISEGGLGRGAFFSRVLPQTYLKGKFDPPGFALELAYKDVNLAIELANEFKVPMTQTSNTLQELMSAINRGWSKRDSRIFMCLQEERAGGIEVRIPQP
jgi:3-hydroxyisobutyrate dehydrogenase-like beta-hydroxyacid dehydrogenase